MPLSANAAGWLRYKWTWAKKGRLVWLNLVLLLTVLGIVFWCRAPDPNDPLRLRILGGSLQLLGVATVWYDLSATARQFGKQGFVRDTLSWLAKFRSPPVVFASSVGRMSAFGNAAFVGTSYVNPNLPIAERVAHLERLADEFAETLARTEREAKDRDRVIESQIKAEVASLTAEIAQVRESMKQATTGNHAWLAFGAWWLGVGVVLATWPAEIAKAVEGRWDLIVKVL